jgi:hypothetical protein
MVAGNCSVLVVAVMLAVPLSAQAQEPIAALKTCMADHTTGKDRKDLAKWIFLAMAAHPEIKEHAGPNVTAALDESARSTAALVTRLLTESCADQARAVVQTGQAAQAFQVAFSGLGELAMKELMADKAVLESMTSFQKYLDQKRLNEALAPR